MRSDGTPHSANVRRSTVRQEEKRQARSAEKAKRKRPEQRESCIRAVEYSGRFFKKTRAKKGRGGEDCPEKVSSLEKVGDNRKLLTASFCSKIVSK